MLTPAQLATIKAFVLADPTLAAFPRNSDGDYEIAALLNTEASPGYYVWKTSVATDEVMRNGMDWTRVDNLSVGKSRIWEWMTSLGTFNPSKVNVRAGIDACWVGTSADLAVRAQVYAHCYRTASVIEKLFGTGNGTTASPSTMDFEGPVSYQDIGVARAS